MSLRFLAGSSALVLVMTSSALLADVTPEQVWQGWQDASSAMGNKVAAESATRDGDTLVVSKITVGDTANGQAAIDTISFKDNGDGTVGVILPDSYPLRVHVPAAEGEADAKPTDLVLQIAAPGQKITASGTPEAISYKTEAPSLTATLDEVDGEKAAAAGMNVEVKLDGVAGSYLVEKGEMDKLTQDFAVKSISIAAKGAAPDKSSDFDITASFADLSGKFDATAPKQDDKSDLAAALAKGLTIVGNFSYGASKFDVNATEAGKPTQMAGAMDGGALAVAMDKTKLDYTTDSKGVSFKIVSPEIPLPDASFSYAEAGFHLLVPVSKSDAPADFALSLTLSGLSVSEAIWAMVDPNKDLSHDPATLVVDTTGKATLTRDLMQDAMALEGGEADSPGQLEALDLNNFDLKAVGAEVTAKGGFTFDNTDTTTFDGVPMPTGKIDIKATGVNALIDTLVKMGIVPQDQAMQGRMMLAMFANTSTSADEMTSTLEFKDKHFFANGQQLQ